MAYEMRISYWSADVCSSDLLPGAADRSVFAQPNEEPGAEPALIAPFRLDTQADFRLCRPLGTPHGFPDSQAAWDNGRMGEWPRHKHNHAMAHFSREDLPFQYALAERSEEHTSELQSLMRISYAVFCLNQKKKHKHKN